MYKLVVRKANVKWAVWLTHPDPRSWRNLGFRNTEQDALTLAKQIREGLISNDVVTEHK